VDALVNGPGSVKWVGNGDGDMDGDGGERDGGEGLPGGK